MSRGQAFRCSAWSSLILLCAGAALADPAVPATALAAAAPNSVDAAAQPPSRDTAVQPSSPAAAIQPSSPATAAPPGAPAVALPGAPTAALPPSTPAVAAPPNAPTAVLPSPAKAVDNCPAIDGCVDQYLWSLYERTPKIDTIKETEKRKVTVKRKGRKRTVTETVTKLVDENFAWKDLKAAQRVGLTPMGYVIDGMDPTFKLTLYRALRALDDAGFEPGITSAFRDDYRQSIATGLKARSDRSYHGGSTRGGYGHGVAADIVSVKGATRAERYVSSEDMWKWIDAHGKELGIGRPYLDRDAPHVASMAGEEYAKHRGSPTRVASVSASTPHVAARHPSIAHVAAGHPPASHVAARHASARRIAARHAPVRRVAAERAKAPRIMAEYAPTRRVAAGELNNRRLEQHDARRPRHARTAAASKLDRPARHGAGRPAAATRARARRTHHADAAPGAAIRARHALAATPASG